MSFAPQASFLAGAQPNKVDPSGVVAADFDGDDHPDLAVAEDFSGDVSVLLAQPDGSFGPPTEFGGGLEPGLFAADGIVVGDLNGDRDPDLAVNNYPSNTVSVLLGGTGT
jgi:hypothetical protein